MPDESRPTDEQRADVRESLPARQGVLRPVDPDPEDAETNLEDVGTNPENLEADPGDAVTPADADPHDIETRDVETRADPDPEDAEAEGAGADLEPGVVDDVPEEIPAPEEDVEPEDVEPEDVEPEDVEPEDDDGLEYAADFPTAPVHDAGAQSPVAAAPPADDEPETVAAGDLDEDDFVEDAAPQEPAEDDFEEQTRQPRADVDSDPAAGSDLDQGPDLAPVDLPPADLPPADAAPVDLPPADAAPAHLAVPPADLPPADAAPADLAPPTDISVPTQASPAVKNLTPRMRLLYAMRPRGTRAQLLAMLLCFVLGLAGFLAVRQNQSLGLASLRQSDLVSLLDNVTEKSNRLEDETRRLQSVADQLKSGSDKSAAALQAAQQRLELLGILAGTSPATGPGIQLTITDNGAHKVTAPTVLDTVEELRDAGAEAIQIGSVRVVANSAFVDGDNGVRVDGVELHSPYVLLVIGDPQTLSSALGIPGGVIESLKRDGETGTIDLRQNLTVSALRPVSAPQYAHPATSGAP